MGKKYQIGSKKEVTETEKMLKDAVGKVANFGMTDSGDYSVLIEEVNGSKIKGLVLDFTSCYSSAAFPNSSVPLIERDEFDLEDPDIAEWDISIREATSEEKYYETSAIRKQKDFLVKMIDVKQPHTYQSLQFDIIDVTTGNEDEGPGVYCEMHMENVIELDMNSDVKNPYVVENSIYANTYAQMNDAYETYSSCEGVVMPDTNVKFRILQETKDRLLNLCTIEVPYAVTVERGLDMFPIDLSDKMKQHINHAFRFMHEHEYQEPMIEKETGISLNESLVKETSKETDFECGL